MKLRPLSTLGEKVVNDFTRSNILYFPHIEIRDTACLKSALCIWDTVFRIVPDRYTPNDDDEVLQAIDAGAVRNVRLSPGDLTEARETYHDFLECVSYLPDALDRPPRGATYVHREKMDERMETELSDLLGSLTRDGDWLQLPRGLADGYMLFLSNAVARKRQLPKFTDSEAMFVSMQYFDMNGNFEENVYPSEEDDFAAALLVRSMVPQGIERAEMSTVLKFRDANQEGREAFRKSVTQLATALSKIEDEEYLDDIVETFKTRLQESNKISLARIREHFSGPESVLFYLGLPLAAKAFELATDVKHSVISLGAFGIAGISALADIAQSRRKEWTPADATYYCKLKESFEDKSPIPKRMRALGGLMDEFMND